MKKLNDVELFESVVRGARYALLHVSIEIRAISARIKDRIILTSTNLVTVLIMRFKRNCFTNNLI